LSEIVLTKLIFRFADEADGTLNSGDSSSPRDGWLNNGFLLAGEDDFAIRVKHRDDTVTVRPDRQRSRQATCWIDQSKSSGFDRLRRYNFSLSMDRRRREDVLFNEATK